MCKQPFDQTSRLFVVNCHQNECFDPKCSGKSKCSKPHCQFFAHLGCLYQMQIYDITIENSTTAVSKFKLLCWKHSVQKYKGFTMIEAQEWVMKRYFPDQPNQQQYYQPEYQSGYGQQQPNNPKAAEYQQGYRYDQNSYNQSQTQGKQQYNNQQHQQQQQQTGTPQNYNQATNQQGIVQNQQAHHGGQYQQNPQKGQIQQGYPPQHNQGQKKGQPFQQQSQQTNPQPYQQQPQPQQPNTNQEQYQKQPQAGGQNPAQYDGYQKRDQRNVNPEYPHAQQYSQQTYDSNGNPVQIQSQQPTPLQAINQSGAQGANSNLPYDQNTPAGSAALPNNGDNSTYPPIPSEGFPPMQQGGGVQQQKGPHPQQQGQITKNMHPPKAWQQPSSQQQGANMPNQNMPYPNPNQRNVQTSQYPSQQRYPQGPNSFQQGFEDKNQGQNQFNQPKPYQGAGQNNQDFSNNNANNNTAPSNSNNGQYTYQPFPSNQSGQRGYNSNYQSAQFADTGAFNGNSNAIAAGANQNNNPSNNNDNFGNQMGYDRQDVYQQNDRNQYNNQHYQGGVRGTDTPKAVQGHDNTYSFTSNNPPTMGGVVKQQQQQQHPPIAQQEYANPQTNAPPPVPASLPYSVNSMGRKIINPNVDTNPNGISVDITDHVQMKRIQQQSKKVAEQAPPPPQIPQGQPFTENISETSPFQRTNSTIQSTPGLGPTQAPPHGDSRNQNAQPNNNNNNLQGGSIKNQQQYFQNQQYPNNGTNNQFQNPISSQQQIPPNLPPGQYPYQNPQQNYNNQYPIQQQNQSFQNNNQQYPISINKTGNQTNSNPQNNHPYPQDKMQMPPQRQKSHQSAGGQQILDQGSTNAANFGVPLNRRPSQQHQPQQHMYASHQQQTAQFGIQQGPQPQIQNDLPQNGYQANNQGKGIDQEEQMQIEEPSQSSHLAATSLTTAKSAPAKKRGVGTKKSKKETEAAQAEAQKLGDVPLKHTKSTQKKMEKKKGKKATNMEEEDEEEGVPPTNPPNIDQQMKEESSTVQQTQIANQENQHVGQNNQLQQFGSENYIANKIESYDSSDFKSATSLGNHVQRQNAQVPKEQPSGQMQQQPHFLGTQPPLNSKQSSTQPPLQQQQQGVVGLPHGNLTQPPQNAPIPPPLTKMPSQSMFPPTNIERFNSQNQHNDIPIQQLQRHSSGAAAPIQPNNNGVPPAQINRPMKSQLFPQQQQLVTPNQPIKKKSGPLINESYKPYFVELVDIQSQIQRQNMQFHQMMMKQHMMMQPQPHGVANGQQQYLQNSQGQRVLQQQQQGLVPPPNAPYMSANQQFPQPPPPAGMHIAPGQGKQYAVKNGQPQQLQNVPNQQVLQPQKIQNIPPGANTLPQQQQQQPQQFPQNTLVPPQQIANGKDFKNEMGGYHPSLNSNQNQQERGREGIFPFNNNQQKQGMGNNHPPGPYNQFAQKNQFPGDPNRNMKGMYPQQYSQTQLPPPNTFPQQNPQHPSNANNTFMQPNVYRDQQNLDPTQQNFQNSKYSNNQLDNTSGVVVGEHNNNLNHSFNPKYQLQSSNQYYSQQQINSDKQINLQNSQQSINLPSQQNILLSSQQQPIPFQQQQPSQTQIQQHPSQQQHPVSSLESLDQNNMLKSNTINNNIYQKSGVPFRQPSGANHALNAIAHPSTHAQSSNQGLQTAGVVYRNPSIQSTDQLNQPQMNSITSSTSINPQKSSNINAHTQAADNALENIREEDLFGEEISESEDTFWEYQPPEDWQHLLPAQQQSSSNNQSQPSRNKSKLGGIANQSSQAQTKSNKKGSASSQNNQNNLKEKDPFFGIDPLKIIVKDFPQGEDVDSVFQWWDQIDDVYFPSKIKDGFFNMLDFDKAKNISDLLQCMDDVEIEENGITKRIPPTKFFQAQATISSENSSIYYLITKDNYKAEPLPYKQPNYFSVLYYNKMTAPVNDPSEDQSTSILKRLQQTQGILAVYKLKMYDKKRMLTSSDKSVFDQIASQVEFISANDNQKIENIFQQFDYMHQFSVNQEIPKSKKQGRQSVNREKPDLKGYEPTICKQFVSNEQVIPISQLQRKTSTNDQSSSTSTGFNYDKNKISFKLKKLISLDKQALYSALQSSNFLNKLLKKKEKSSTKSEFEIEEDSDSETTSQFVNLGNNQNQSPIESNILALEYELQKLQVDSQLNSLKQAVSERSKREGNYLELRNLSVLINDNLKWLTIRKNLMLGFSDRLAYDSENYFNYEAEEKSGINFSYSEVLKEKEMFEKMSSAEQEKLSLQRQVSAANELHQKQQERLQRQQQKKEKEEEEDEEEDEEENKKQGAGKSVPNAKDKQKNRKQNEDHDDENDDEYNQDDEEGDEDSNQIFNKKDADNKRSRRRGGDSRVRRILDDEGNAQNNSNENSIDGTDNVHESDRAESPAITRNKNLEDDADIKKSETKNKLSSSTNNKKKKKQKSKSKAKFLETDCSVCFHHVNNENNTVVYCSQCNGSFHKHCYGIDFIPEEKFLCKKCEYKNQQMMKKKSSSNCQKQPLKEDYSKQFHCKLCTETLLPVISIYDDSYFYHPTCLFIFNYAIYKDQSLQLRDNVTHQQIAEDVKKQNHIACEFCSSKKGLKVKCCHFGKPRRSYQQFYGKPKKYTLKSKKNEFKFTFNPDSSVPKKEEIKDEEKSIQHQSSVNERSSIIDQKIEEEEGKQEQQSQFEIKSEFPKEIGDNLPVKQNTDEIKIEEEEELENSDEDCFVSEEDDCLENDEDDDCDQEVGCNYYVHPLCAFLNGLEIWLDSRDEDPDCEKVIIDSDFQNLQHLGLKIIFKCKEHADRKNRNYDEQIYFRRYQINYLNICTYTTFPEYEQFIMKERTHEEEVWNEISNLQKESKENYKYLTKIKLNRREIEASHQQAELYYLQNPHLREELQILELEELEEEVAAQKEENTIQSHHQQQSLMNIEEEDEDGNLTQNNDEANNTFDELDYRTHMEEEQDDDDENSQNKRRSRRHQNRKLIQLQQTNSDKNQGHFEDDFDPQEYEFSQDDNKKEGSRNKNQNQKRSSTRAAGQASQTSLSSTGDANRNRRSRRLIHNNNQKGKSQYSNFLNADEDEENQDSSFNQGLSSFENTLNKVTLRENSNNADSIEKQTSPKLHEQSSLAILAQFTTSSDKKHSSQAEEDQLFKGISKNQKHSKQVQKGKKNSTSKQYCEDEANQDQDDEQSLELDEDYFDCDQAQDEQQDDEDEDDDSHKRGMGKMTRNKRRSDRKNRKSNQNDLSSSSPENHNKSQIHSRGNSPPNRSNGASYSSTTNKQEIQKILSHAHSLAKNGKIGKGTSIFATQNKRKKSNKDIVSKQSLYSNDEEEEELEYEGVHTQIEDQINENDPIIHQEDELTRNHEQVLLHKLAQKLESSSAQQKPIAEKQEPSENIEEVSSLGQEKMVIEDKDEQEIQNEAQQNQELKNSQSQKRQKSPELTKTSQEQVHKQDLEGDNLKLQTQNSDNQSQAAHAKYNLRKHQIKNYKYNAFHTDQITQEEEIHLIAQATIASMASGKKKSQSLTTQSNTEKLETPSDASNLNQKAKNKKNQKQQHTSQQNINISKKGSENEQLQNEESSSSHANNTQSANNQIHRQTKRSTRGKASIVDHGDKSSAIEEEVSQTSHNTQNNQTSQPIFNPKDSQDLLDFDQFEEKNQILNPYNKYN